MRLALFLLLSIAVHSAILSLPVLFSSGEAGPIVPVILLGDGGDGGSGPAGGSGKEDKGRKFAPAARGYHSGTQGMEEHNFSAAGDTQEIAKVQDKVSLAAQESFEKGLIVAGFKGDEERRGIVLVGIEGRGGGESGGSGNAQKIGTASGGSGEGGGSPGSRFAQASYAYNPKPKYPDAARKEGWEGTVLLKVLVDREGKSRSIEVSHSSGFETLDRVAMETVRVWRFHPAHYGERLVESWVKIPIIFSLADYDRGS